MSPSHRSIRSGAGARVGAGVLLAVLAALAGALLAAAPAYAHAVLLDSDPADGQVLDLAPAEVVLRFNEPVEPPPDPVRVFDGGGNRVDAGDAGHGANLATLRLSLRPDLPDGVYVVSWRAVSADAHPVRGSFVFVVGDPAGVDPDTVAVPDAEADTAWQVAAGLVRWVTYAGALLAAGAVAFLGWVARDAGHGERRRLVRVAGLAVAAGLAGTVVGLPLQAVLVYGVGAMTDEALLAGTVASSYGASTLVRLAGLTVLLVGVAGLGAVRWAAPAAVTGAVATLGSFLLAGHTVTGEPRLLVAASNLAHTSAAAVWLAGLVLLWVLLRHRRRTGGDAAGGARLVTRFSNLAVASVLLVGAAGVVLGWAETRTWAGLFSTGYGWVLLAKAALVAAVVAVGGYNNRALVPAIRRGAGPGAWQRLQRTVRVEAAVILVGVLGVTAVLVVTPPGRHQVHAADPAPAAKPYDEILPLGPEHQVRLVVEPAAAGTNEVTVHLLDLAGNPADIGEQVELRFSQPAAGIERITREPEPADPGVWSHTGPELSIAGTWQVEVRVLVDDFQRVTATADVPVAPGGDLEHDDHP